MNEQYQYVGKTLTRSIAEELIRELFTGQTIQKQEIKDVVEETHLQRGGLPSIAQRNNPVTLALWHMECEGYVEKNPNQGTCFIVSRNQDADKMDSDQDNIGADILEPEKTIGSGKQSVYLYYYPAYKCLAENQEKKVWECKIGKARNDPISRILSQTRTALPEYPKVGLIIKTDDLNLMERTIQNILRLQGKQKQDSPGNEWFITSPSEVEQVYETNFGNLQ